MQVDLLFVRMFKAITRSDTINFKQHGDPDIQDVRVLPEPVPEM
jgi:hypothetical protein